MITNQTRSGELSVAGGWRMGGWGVTFLIHSKSNCSLPSRQYKICFLLHQLISPGGGGGHLVTGSVITLHWQEERRRTIAQFTQSIELFVRPPPPQPPTPSPVFVNVIIWKLTPVSWSWSGIRCSKIYISLSVSNVQFTDRERDSKSGGVWRVSVLVFISRQSSTWQTLLTQIIHSPRQSLHLQTIIF